MLARPADWRCAIAYTGEARLGAMGEAARYSPNCLDSSTSHPRTRNERHRCRASRFSMGTSHTG
jgi:hypothetical protein